MSEVKLGDVVDVFSCCILNWDAFTTMLPAFVIAGGISIFISRASVIKYLGGKVKKTLSYSVSSVSGVILSLCSCNVVPLFSSIYRRGAGIGPAFAFLYAGPAINFVSLIFLFRVVGLGIGVYRLLMVPVIAVIVGSIMVFIFRKEEAERVTQIAQLKVVEEERRTPKQTAFVLGLLLLILIIGAGEVPKKVYMGDLVISDINRWAVKLPLLAFLVAPLVMAVRRWFTREELVEWAKETGDIVKKVVPILVPSVFAIGFLVLKIPLGSVYKILSQNSLLSTFLASLFGSFMYFPILTEIALTKAFLKMFSMGMGPAMGLLLTGPGLSLPGMVLLQRFIGLKKVAVYVGLMLIFTTMAAYFWGWKVGPYVCTCLQNLSPSEAWAWELRLW